MPVCVPTPVAPLERCDYLPWISSAFDDELPLDIDGMSFDHISNVLSRCATPPPESMAASPMESAMTSPDQSRCPSPIQVSFFLDSLFEYDELDSAATSLASTPFSSSPASPAPLSHNHTAPCTPTAPLPSSSSSSSFTYSSPCSPMNSNMATIATLKQQARRYTKSGELKPMKAKKMAKDASQTSPSASIAALCLSNANMSSNSSTSSSSSSTSTSSSMANNKASKRNKALALASKRDSHNISERNRRQELKLSFNVLQSIVPNLISASRAHTGTVLKETIAYIVALQQQEEQLIAAKNALLAEQSILLLSQ